MHANASPKDIVVKKGSHLTLQKKMEEWNVTLEKEGYIVLRQKVNIPPFDALLSDIEKAKRHPIFQRGEKLRFQAPIIKKQKALFALMNDAAHVVKQVLPQHFANSGVLLISEPGCAVQPAHSDYPPFTKTIYHSARLRSKEKSLSALSDLKACGCILAIMPATTLTVWKGVFSHSLERILPHQDWVYPSIVSLEPGDLLLFTSDFIHAGSAYNILNYRIHLYVDSPTQSHLMDRTWRVDINGPKHSRVVELLQDDPSNNDKTYIRVVQGNQQDEYWEWDSLTSTEQKKWEGHPCFYVTQFLQPKQGSAFPYPPPHAKIRRCPFLGGIPCIWWQKSYYHLEDPKIAKIKDRIPGINQFWMLEDKSCCTIQVPIQCTKECKHAKCKHGCENKQETVNV